MSSVPHLPKYKTKIFSHNSSSEKCGVYPKIVHTMKHVPCSCFPENWRLWRHAFYMRGCLTFR